ncbi:Vitamin B12 import ATP-binding protein BtuD [Streptomyces alboniger]
MRYRSQDVLKGVGFTARRGEVVLLLGPNGAGKTTTIEVLEGFRMRSAGDVTVLGTDPAGGDERWRARLGIVLQSWRDHGKWRVRELLAHLGSYYAPYSTALVRRPWDVDELLAAVGLTEQADKRVGTLSGGQRRRFDVAVGIVGRPEVLFLDEPTAGLDPEARNEFHGLVRGLADENTTVLLTTHDLAEAERLADRILILAGGRIVADGSAEELSRQASAEATVRWTRDGRPFEEATAEPTRFVRRLFEEHGEAIGGLEVRRASLEDTYLRMVRELEAGSVPDERAVHAFGEGVAISPVWHAAVAGVRRGSTELRQSFTTGQDVFGYVLWTVLLIVPLFLGRDDPLKGAGISAGAFMLPSMLGMTLAFAGMMTAAQLRDRARGRHTSAGQGRASRHGGPPGRQDNHGVGYGSRLPCHSPSPWACSWWKDQAGRRSVADAGVGGTAGSPGNPADGRRHSPPPYPAEGGQRDLPRRGAAVAALEAPAAADPRPAAIRRVTAAVAARRAVLRLRLRTRLMCSPVGTSCTERSVRIVRS